MAKSCTSAKNVVIMSRPSVPSSTSRCQRLWLFRSNNLQSGCFTLCDAGWTTGGASNRQFSRRWSL